MKTSVQLREKVSDPIGPLWQRIGNHVDGNVQPQAQVWNRVEGQVENGLWQYVQDTLKEYVSN